MRRQKLPPDTRLDWRDPNMPVLCRSGGKIIALTPQEAQADAFVSMFLYDRCPQHQHSDNWRNDPLYNAARKRR